MPNEAARPGLGEAMPRNVAIPFGRIHQSSRPLHRRGRGNQTRGRGGGTHGTNHGAGPTPGRHEASHPVATGSAETVPVRLAKIYVELEQRHEHVAQVIDCHNG